MPRLETGAGPIVSSELLKTLDIEPPLETPVWQTHAVFNHRKHRALGCAVCHGGASTSKENGEKPLLPGIKECAACHAPEGGRVPSQPGGASTACTECHRYHNGDQPEQGLGARARRGAIEHTLESFLRGIPQQENGPR